MLCDNIMKDLRVTLGPYLMEASVSGTVYDTVNRNYKLVPPRYLNYDEIYFIKRSRAMI
jgi:hypothetical protein